MRWRDRTCREATYDAGCVSRESVIAAADLAASPPDAPAVRVLTTYPVQHARLQLEHSVTGAMVKDEDQYLYRLLPQAR